MNNLLTKKNPDILIVFIYHDVFSLLIKDLKGTFLDIYFEKMKKKSTMKSCIVVVIHIIEKSINNTTKYSLLRL